MYDSAALIKANDLCNELGIDTMDMGGAIACAMELYEKGLLPAAEVGGRLDFGSAEAMVEMVRRTGRRQGFGDILAEGAYRLAQRYNGEESFIGVKGQEAPPYDPRGIQGLGLQYATSNSGACCRSGYVVTSEILGVRQEADPAVTEGKAPLVKLFQDVTAAMDSAGICFLTFLGGLWVIELFAMLEVVTAAGFSERGLLLTGERIYNLERLFNLRAGFGAKDDTLPRRMLEQPLPGGPAQGQVCRLDEMLPEYYRLRGWDESGFPTAEKLTELGLDGLFSAKKA